MAKIKHTKNELKAQREALKRFQRYLPMLILKQQQLQSEIQNIDAAIAEQRAIEHEIWETLPSWIKLFSEPIGIETMTHVREIKLTASNIAGVAIPVFEDIIFKRAAINLYSTPPWVDAGLDVIEHLITIRTRIKVLEEQRARVAKELRTTTQRVNLFEKVKIPECAEHIRVIRIFLGDEQTAAVARGKMAKARLEAKDSAETNGMEVIGA